MEKCRNLVKWNLSLPTHQVVFVRKSNKCWNDFKPEKAFGSDDSLQPQQGISVVTIVSPIESLSWVKFLGLGRQDGTTSDGG